MTGGVVDWTQHLKWLEKQVRYQQEQADKYRFEGKYHLEAMARNNAEHYADMLTKATAEQLADPARTGESGQGIPDDAA